LFTCDTDDNREQAKKKTEERNLTTKRKDK
jgi:hypothetical protein